MENLPSISPNKLKMPKANFVNGRNMIGRPTDTAEIPAVSRKMKSPIGLIIAASVVVLVVILLLCLVKCYRKARKHKEKNDNESQSKLILPKLGIPEMKKVVVQPSVKDLACVSPTTHCSIKISKRHINGRMDSNDDEEPMTIIDKTYHCPVTAEDDIQHETSRARTQLYVAIFICVAFIAGEVAGGYFSNSLAIITDAAHMLSDLASLLTSIVAIRIAAWPANKSHTFGFYRAEMIGAFLTILLGWIVAAFLTYYAIERIIYHNYHIEANTMLITAAFCLLANILMGLVLFIPNTGKLHGHSHGSAKPSHAHDTQNINIRAAFIHILGDTLCTFGLLIAAITIKFKPNLTIIDPICTLIFSIISVIVSLNVFKDIMKVFLEAVPIQFTYDGVNNSLESIEGVTQVHCLRMWCLTIDCLSANVHLIIDENANQNEVLYQATKILKQEYKIKFVCVQVENGFESWIEIHNQAEATKANPFSPAE